MRTQAMRMLPILLLLLTAETARAELIALNVKQRVPYAQGKSFGDVGPYEIIAGVAQFAVDPKDPANSKIIDLDLAPKNAQGKVEFAADFAILAPKDPSRGNGAIFYDVNNRGKKLALGFFNYGSGGNDLTTKGCEGDGFLMRRGYTVVWSGWLGEILAGEGRMLLQAPQIAGIRGKVRFEFAADAPSKSIPISRREGHGAYSPTSEGEEKGVLTWRRNEADPRQPIARNKWKLERMPVADNPNGAAGTLGQIRCHLEGGFEPGIIYELICECDGPIVQGLGFAATRDLISYLRHDTSPANPVAKSINRAHSFGVSQSGRYLRHLLWQGFNDDEKGRIVFDGLIPHVAGGGLGFFNHRFAQPTRHNGQHEDHLYPNDIFPFNYGTSTDPLSGRTDGILKVGEKSKQQPKVMHTQSAAEYWHRSGSLVHTDPLGKVDVEIPANVRIYAFGGTQHGPASNPPGRGFAEYLNNPGDYKPQLRALLDALDAWVKEGKQPPASVYPKIADGTLIDFKSAGQSFPKIPGVRYPQVIQAPPFADYGPEFFTRGIVGNEPPVVKGQYVVKVFKADADGNDLGSLLPVEVAVPLATYTGWNLRHKDVGGDGMLANLLGSYLPFAKTKAEREKSGDPRPSLEERYGSFEKYQAKFREQCEAMVRQRVLLEEDSARLIASRAKEYQR